MNPVQIEAMVFTYKGFGDLDEEEWDNAAGDDDCECEGGSEEGNHESGNNSCCTFGVGTGGDGI